MIRAIGIGCLCGILGAAVVFGGAHRNVLREIDDQISRSAEIESQLAPLAFERDLCARIGTLWRERQVLSDITEHLFEGRIDVTALDESLATSATRAHVTLEQAVWHHDKIQITLRTKNPEDLVDFALFCADSPNLRGLEIKRWDGEDQIDRFVVIAEWVPSPEED